MAHSLPMLQRELKRELIYLIRHCNVYLSNYPACTIRDLPIRTGAIESRSRRVIILDAATTRCSGNAESIHWVRCQTFAVCGTSVSRQRVNACSGTPAPTGPGRGSVCVTKLKPKPLSHQQTMNKQQIQSCGMGSHSICSACLRISNSTSSKSFSLATGERFTECK